MKGPPHPNICFFFFKWCRFQDKCPNQGTLLKPHVASLPTPQSSTCIRISLCLGLNEAFSWSRMKCFSAALGESLASLVMDCTCGAGLSVGYCWKVPLVDSLAAFYFFPQCLILFSQSVCLWRPVRTACFLPARSQQSSQETEVNVTGINVIIKVWCILFFPCQNGTEQSDLRTFGLLSLVRMQSIGTMQSVFWASLPVSGSNPGHEQLSQPWILGWLLRAGILLHTFENTFSKKPSKALRVFSCWNVSWPESLQLQKPGLTGLLDPCLVLSRLKVWKKMDKVVDSTHGHKLNGQVAQAGLGCCHPGRNSILFAMSRLCWTFLSKERIIYCPCLASGPSKLASQK